MATMDRELNISLVGVSVAAPGSAITVQVTEGGLYSIVEEALRRFTGWITVAAEYICRNIVRRVRTYVRRAFRMTGVQLLRRYSILRF